MKKIMISSILVATACLTMIGQANAAPHFTKHHAAQVQHQKHDNKVNNQHRQMKSKIKNTKYPSKAVSAKYKVKGKYQGKHIKGSAFNR